MSEIEDFTHSAPASLVKLGAVCDGLKKVKLDAIQSILTEGKWLFQTAMDPAEISQLRDQLDATEPPEQVDTPPLIVIDPDSSLASEAEDQAANSYMHAQGFITVDSLDKEIAAAKSHPNPSKGGECDVKLHPPMETDEPDPEIITIPSEEEDLEEGEIITVEEATSERVVIFAPGEASAWNTLRDSDTITTPVKQSPKSNSASQLTASDSPHILIALEQAQLRHAIEKEGAPLPDIAPWKQKYRGVSLHILHDGLLRNWPQDRKCCVTEARGSAREWADRIREAKIRLRGHSVVLALQTLQNTSVLSILRNQLSAIVRAIRAAKPGIRIYFCETITLGNVSVNNPVHRHNELMFTALHNLHITNDLHKVFHVCMSPYFSRGDSHLLHHDRLTRLGCLHYRANLFREVGLVSYHDI